MARGSRAHAVAVGGAVGDRAPAAVVPRSFTATFAAGRPVEKVEHVVVMALMRLGSSFSSRRVGDLVLLGRGDAQQSRRARAAAALSRASISSAVSPVATRCPEPARSNRRCPSRARGKVSPAAAAPAFARLPPTARWSELRAQRTRRHRYADGARTPSSQSRSSIAAAHASAASCSACTEPERTTRASRAPTPKRRSSARAPRPPPLPRRAVQLLDRHAGTCAHASSSSRANAAATHRSRALVSSSG